MSDLQQRLDAEAKAERAGRLAALREVREMIDKRLGASYNDAIRGHRRYFMRKIYSMIAKEEGQK